MDPFHTKAKYLTAYVSIKHCTIQSFEHENAKKVYYETDIPWDRRQPLPVSLRFGHVADSFYDTLYV